MMTVKQIVEETIEYYKNNPRGTNEKTYSCEYYFNGAMCAVGRCLIDPEGVQSRLKENPEYIGLSGVFNVWSGDLVFDEELKEPYRGHPLSFWSVLQGLHDNKEHWDESGNLTFDGEEFVKEILNDYANEN